MALPANLQPLLRPEAFAHPVTEVRLVETPISWLLLTGSVVYKIKRPVHFAFIDLRSQERRAFLCAEEVRLNRRFAPGIYLGVSHITADVAGTCIDGTGSAIESCVRMRQFDANCELDHLLERGAIAAGELFAFGRELARLHASLPVAGSEHEWGRPAAVRAALLRNFDECVELLGDLLPAADPVRLRVELGNAADRATAWMAERRRGGRVRECHGDLHCSNIVRLDGRLCAFDCLEFDPALRWIDVADEISFLLADLTPYEPAALRQAFLGGYLLESGDFEACRFLFLYQAHRCLVRAKVLALSGAGEAACRFIEAAGVALAPGRPVLILMSGLSGSGKSWLAERLAPSLGAVHVRSDIERKRLAGIDIEARASAQPGKGLYTSEISQHLQEHLLKAADSLVAGGFTTVIDATFIHREYRRAFLDWAARLNVTVKIVRCEAPESILRARIEERARRGGDPSDADLSVLQWQISHDEAFEPAEAACLLRVNTADEGALEQVRRHLMLDSV